MQFISTPLQNLLGTEYLLPSSSSLLISYGIKPSPSVSVTERLQRHAVFLFALKGHPELKQLDNHIAEFLEEGPVVLCVPLHVLLEYRVLDERHIGWQHHQRLALRVLILPRAIPLPPPPILGQEQPEVIVGDDGGGEAPGPFEAGAVRVAAAEGVGAGQGDDLAVVEPHAVENGAQVRLFFRAVREAAVGRAHGDVAVGAAGAPWDGGTLHFLDGADAGKGPEVGVGYPGVFFWK